MNEIKIANWLLTRRCNLHCSYCAITKDYKKKPTEYPDMSYYKDNEMSTKTVISYFDLLKRHNPDMFHVIYGGEPLLRKDLPQIIEHCNQENIHYTIITNNSDDIQPLLSNLFENVSKISGLTSSVDPLVYDDNITGDIKEKSLAGLKRLKEATQKVKDVVAEITVTNENFKYLYRLIKELSDNGITSSITFIDPAKNPYYDFSNVGDECRVFRSKELELEMLKIVTDETLLIHMRSSILHIMNCLPSKMDCEIEKSLHNITIDADGRMRICLRIRGVKVPTMTLRDCIQQSDAKVDPVFKKILFLDKIDYCQLCNWTCMIFSKLASDEKEVPNLIHSDKRLEV